MATPEVKINPLADTRAIKNSADRIRNLLAMHKQTSDSGRRHDLIRKIGAESQKIMEASGMPAPVHSRRRQKVQLHA
ncbi:MAG: hypothetical protein M1530_03650 [Candidatus Marsarchaeota archaeon]|nr:hypothetical protein [Candidatus Marsarchaeota archaeon]